MQESYLDVNQRAAFFQYAYSSAPAMVMRTLGGGSKYPFTARDADGNVLNGSNTYRLHLPPHPPAALFWAVTAYNVVDGTMPETPQLLPSINGYYDLATNGDGSIDIWFGLKLPDNVSKSNWIQTVDERDFLVALRLYGAEAEFYDQTWKLDDIVKVKKGPHSVYLVQDITHHRPAPHLVYGILAQNPVVVEGWNGFLLFLQVDPEVQKGGQFLIAMG